MPDNAKSTRDFVEQIRNASAEELEERLRHIQEGLFNLRFRLASGQIEDPKRVRKYRKAVARIRTVQQERGLL
jgi:large subunit ribosomal protein L29